LKNPDYNLTYIKKWIREFEAALGEDYLELFKKTLDGLND